MNADRFITLAIHTYDKAIALKALLEREGVNSVLNNVNLTAPAVSSGVRVRIKEKDLPLALRIVENLDIFDRKLNSQDHQPKILVPVDFSDYSHRACLMAFNLAKTYNASIDILHSFIYTHPIDKLTKFDDDLSLRELNDKIERDAQVQMAKFSEKLIEQIKFGIIPPIRFNTTVKEGVPEDIISEFAKQMRPYMIVMGTRGSGKKEKELIGSVTGEVLDSCRFPVFAVPESANIFDIKKLNHLVFFCNNEHEDIVALDTMYRLFPQISPHVTIITIPHKTITIVDSFISSNEELQKYCKENFPRFNVKIKSFDLKDINSEFEHIEREHKIDLIVVPNKKKNVFSRFFNPSLAHKILLHADIPMITIPI